jgi:hypothetical protein
MRNARGKNGLGENMAKTAIVRSPTRVTGQSIPLFDHNREGVVANYSYSSLEKTVTLINLLVHHHVFIQRPLYLIILVSKISENFLKYL